MKKLLLSLVILSSLIIPPVQAQLENLGDIGGFSAENLISTMYKILGPIGRLITVALEAIFALAIVVILLYWFVYRPNFIFKIPVRMYEIVQGQVMFSYQDRGGFLINNVGGGQVFKLMRSLREWRKPWLIKPQLSDFQTTLGGKRYINYVRLGKDTYVPFTFVWNLKDKAVVNMAKDLDLDSIKNELTANYIKFREESFWSKYGNQVIFITFAIIMGFFLFIVAKEFTRTASILAGGNEQLASAIRDLGKQIVR